ncbi:MAG: DUF5667 domain-containing protein [Chloroflexi bacterium]|nr:DUF5667 domain-containing protein [Chloroflexota bacterium]
MDDRLHHYPDNLDEAAGEDLSPFVDVVNRLQHAPRPMLNTAAKARIEARLLSPNVVSFQRRTTHRVLFKAIAAVLIVVMFIGGGTAWASEDALPGEPLYPVKRFVEGTRLSFAASESAEVDLRLEFSQRRLDEFEQLLDEGVVDLAVIQDASDEIDHIQRLSASDATRLDLIALTEEQQTLLTKAQQIRPQNHSIQTLMTDIDDRLTHLRLPDLTVCDFEYWKAQPALWSDVVVTINDQTFNQATILAMDTNALFEQYISVQLNIRVNDAPEINALASAKEMLSGTSNEFTAEEITASLGLQCRDSSANEDVEDSAGNPDSSADENPPTDNAGPPPSEAIDCSNPPPPHAPAVGWRERCGEPGPEPGRRGNRQGNQNNNGNNRQGNGPD